jgi:hypothetical protein
MIDSLISLNIRYKYLELLKRRQGFYFLFFWLALASLKELSEKINKSLVLEHLLE